MEEKKLFNYAVNGFRGLCVLLVYIYHIRQSGIVPDLPASSHILQSLSDFAATFRFGVEMFFMISGYVIIGSLKRHKTMKAFLIDRALRIYPTWIPIFLMSFAASFVLKRGMFETWNPKLWAIDFFPALLLMPPIVPLPLVHGAAWSLSYEWCFYLIAGLASFYLVKLCGKYPSTILALIAGLVMINFFPRGLFFIPGILIAFFEEKFIDKKKWFSLPLLGILVFLMAWSQTGADASEQTVCITDWLGDRRILFMILSLLAGIYMFAGIATNAGYMSRLLTTPFFQFYGKISYAFYLWSLVVMMFIKIAAKHWIIPEFGGWTGVIFFGVVSFVLSTAVSWGNWYLIEKKFTKILKVRLMPIRNEP